MGRISLFAIAAASALFSAAICRAGENGSLYDAKHAEKANVEAQQILGPKSGSLRYDPRMLRAAQIALSRAYQHPTWRCWHFVKDALVDAQVIGSRPSSAWAKNAGTELCEKYGFRKLAVRSPEKAPVGAVLVYGGADAGHVEIRTATGYVSDFVSPTPYPRPFLGAYVKPS